MAPIAIICGAGIVSGKEIMATELAEALVASGNAVEIITSRWGNGDFGRRLEAQRIPVQRMWLGFISATLSLDCLRMTTHQVLHWPELMISYGRFLRRARPKRIIHTNWHHLLIVCPFLHPDRDLFWLHEVLPNKPQYRRVFRYLERRLKCFVCVSRAVASSVAIIGITPDKIRVIHNGIADPWPGEKGAAARSKVLRIGIIGQIGAWKGHEDLLEAFALIKKLPILAELHVFGQGSVEFERHLRLSAEVLGVAKRVIWHGFVSDRGAVFRSIDISAVPSRFDEPFGLTAVEAGFCGLPVVATRRGGLPEIIDDRVTGFLVEAQNPPQLAARLVELLQNEKLRKTMGEAARRRMNTHFSHARFKKEFFQLLDM
jgi:glycosyltransferase involved in cell wall biosynthesis